MKQPLALGIDDFREVREEDYFYMDKSLLIETFLESKTKATLITRPRRFGKTLNMTMLKEFFDVTKDSKGIFQGLKIMTSPFASYLNSVPVIFFSFKNCNGNNLDEMLWTFTGEIFKEFERYHDYFTESGLLGSSSTSRFEQLFDYFNDFLHDKPDKDGTLPPIKIPKLTESLTVLIRVIHKTTGKKPIVLIDEYDNPLINCYENGFHKSFSKFYADFLTQALKGNPDLGQTVLTGIQRVAKESIFSKMNHFVVYTVTDEKYAEYFGLTVEETQAALESYGLELSADVQAYYNGYHFGKHQIFNPWSILKYIEKKELAPYWRNTSTNALIRDSIKQADAEFFEAFEELITEGKVDVDINLEASFIEMQATDTLWGLLVNAGYLTTVGKYGTTIRTVAIPNEESRKEFRAIVAAYTKLNSRKLEILFESLYLNDTERFLKLYKEIVYESTSFHDSKENAYHMLFLGMAMAVTGLYKVRSNQEHGDGRPDILMESLQPHRRPHIIVEFKQADNISNAKREALQQILDNLDSRLS